MFKSRKRQGRAKPVLCIAASSGGHLEQAAMLRPLLEDFDGFLVTEQTMCGTPSGFPRTYLLRQVNRREPTAVFKIIANTITSARILARERPDYVICTGVLAVVPLCLLAKMTGAKLIYVESFAKVHSGTLSGRLMYHFADMFLVQWQSMLEVYPKAVYAGSIY